jgi:serine protease inhibitor
MNAFGYGGFRELSNFKSRQVPIIESCESTKKIAQFAFDFLTIISNNYSQQVAVSPLGLFSTCLLLQEGANNATKTELATRTRIENSCEELERIGNLFPTTPTAKTTISNGNGIFTLKNTHILLKYHHDTRNVATVTSCDTPATFVGQVNNFVSTSTRGVIQNIVSLQDVDPNAVLYVVNVLYFKGTWLNTFDFTKTNYRSFNLSSQISTQLLFMNGVSCGRHYENEFVTVGEKPYHDGYSMTFIVPKDGVSLDQAVLATISPNYIMTDEHQIRFSIPKFSQQFSTGLKPIMQAMGVTSAFNQASADFSNLTIAQYDNIYLHQVVQKVVITVDETGSEAAAVTVAQMQGFGVEPKMKSLIANRPFVWLIKDNRGTIYFSGTYAGI